MCECAQHRWQWCICDDSQGRVLYVVVNNSEVVQGDLHCVVISTVVRFSCV